MGGGVCSGRFVYVARFQFIFPYYISQTYIFICSTLVVVYLISVVARSVGKVMGVMPLLGQLA